jgi:hypothetical protein
VVLLPDLSIYSSFPSASRIDFPVVLSEFFAAVFFISIPVIVFWLF